MRVLLSVVGTRGDVQPVLALALELRELGAAVRLCLPPNFVAWAQSLGFEAYPVGIEMRAPRAGATPASPIPDLITDQFEKIAAAARDCAVIVGANAHQYAARSIAELYGIAYLNAVYAPTALPNDATSRTWNERSRERVNANRQRLGLAPVDDVLRHIVTEHPCLATDPTLDPAPELPGLTVTQSGAWLLADSSPLPPVLEEFLAAGEPPVYCGFGSMPVADGTGRTLVEAVRQLGKRAILSRGWAELGGSQDAADSLVIEDVNHQALFARVAAVVHHGGAGTTVAAARAGAPQVVIPMFSDQPYWAERVRQLGIGAGVPIAELSADTLAAALRVATDPATVARAGSLAEKIVLDGAAAAARWVLALGRAP